MPLCGDNKTGTDENMKKYQGIPKATYYRRLKEWTLELFDKDGHAYYVSHKHVMKKPVKKEEE